MKRLTLVAFITMLFVGAQAQLFNIWGIDVGYVYVGPKAGFNLSTISGDVGTGFEKKMNFGYQLGGVAKIGISNKLSVQPELTFTSRGGKTTDNFMTISANYNYIGLPVVVKYGFSSFLGVDVYGSGGFYTDVMTGGKYVTTFEDGFEEPGYKIEGTAWEGYNRVDFGFNFGLGAVIPFKNNDELTVDIRYAQGVVDINKLNTTTTSKSTSFQITALYLIDLTKWVNFRGEKEDNDASHS